nr:homocysteine S-methyltransferase family protein [uncultured Prevotella sp.]
MWKPNLEETKKHYIDWWNHKGIVLNMWEHFQEGVKPHADVPMPPAPKSLDQKWFDPEWRAEYLDWYVAHSSMKADMLPVANTQLGPGSLAAILGGVFEGGEDTIWIHPDPNYTDDIKFDINDPANKNWQLHKDLLRACKKKAKGNYYVGMPDLMEGMDVLAAMKGTDKVLLDTVMQPEVLERQMQQINDIYFQVFDELYDIIREGDEMAFCYFSSWAPGKMTKLQSDISTMISVEDYRRFVQPFIRQQCQKIDYTLYHLDGVGAMHHLPALLEIEELNAIQWTPGVGEPQGGSPKWYDLYKKILAGGKSIMACWVTLDELRPLLDNIGGDGVHIEMDFHNEDEVEKALRIVEEYQESADEPEAADNTIRINKTMTPDEEVMAIIDKIESGDANAASAADVKMKALPLKAATLGRPSMDAVAKERIFVLDGATGTTIQQYKLTEEEFRGERFKDFDGEVRGTNDLLALTCPEIVTSMHRRFLEAGSDLITTNTFNSQRVSLADKHLQDYARELNLEAARLARKEADAYTLMNPRKPRYVLGSVGPTSKTLSIGESAEFNEDILHDAYYEQIEALIDGGVDAVLIETIFDIENAKVALRCCKEVMLKKGFRLPIMMSFTVASEDGHNMLGQSVVDFVKSLNDDSVFSVGLNCSLNAAKMAPIIQRMAAETDYYISMFPNAGLPDEHGHYLDTPKMMQAEVWPIVEAHLLNVVGGCCGTDDLHIREIAKLVQPIEGLFITPHYPGGAGNSGVSGVSSLSSVSSDSSLSRISSFSSISRDSSAPVKEKKCSCGIDHDAAPVATSKPESNTAEEVFEAILAGKGDKAADATKRALDEGVAPQDIINGQMIRAMSEVGQRFQDGKAFVPQLLMAGRAMKAALEILKPLLAGQASTTLGRIVIGTVKGDLHDIGKNLVASMLEGCGFEVKNIGIDVPSDKFVEAVKDYNADILCMSALLTTTMTYMKDVIQALEDAGIRQNVKVMVGGAPVTQNFADEIGADGYSDNANSAVAVAKELMGK